ncbi:MAG: hypothetical protein ABW201_08885 [Candidatus Thiodiazotropha sp.]
MQDKGKAMREIHGGCHCGNITYEIELPNALETYNPRECDCKLCTTHGASYVSDKNGTLNIKIKNNEYVSKYRQGSRIADFIVCKKCGVMTGVCYEEGGVIYGSVNIRATREYGEFGKGQVAHLTELSDKERIARWKDLWFSNIKIESEIA